MRTGEIFARGSCRVLKWMALVGVVFALGSGTAAAQGAVTIDSLSLNAASVMEGEEATATVVFTVTVPSGGTNQDAATATVEFEFHVTGLTTGIAATNATNASFYNLSDDSITSNFQRTVSVGALRAGNRRQYRATHTFGTNHDLDAEDGQFQLSVSVAGIGTEAELNSPTRYVIDDDEEQSYTLSLPAANRGAITEDGAPADVTLTANPGRTAAATVPSFTVVTDPVSPLYTYTAAADYVATELVTAIPGARTSDVVGTIAATVDKNRVDDTVTLVLHSGVLGASAVPHELAIKVTDAQPLPTGGGITAVAKDKDGNDVTMVTEGGDPVYLTISVDRGRGSTAKTTEELTIDIVPANGAQAADFDVTPRRVTLPSVVSAAGTQSTTDTEIKLSAKNDDDVGHEDLELNLVVAGESMYGTETSTGTFSIAITDTTAKLVAAKDDAYDAIMKAMGDDPLNPGDVVQIMTADLFEHDATAVTVSYGTAVEGGAVSASGSSEMVTLTAVSAGDAKVTVTATARSNASSLVITQTESDVVSLTFPVTVVLADLMVEVTADPMELMEGDSTMIMATANRAVTKDTMIALSVVGDDDAYEVGDSITIQSGMESGSVELMASEDDDYMNETLTVVATGPGINGSMQVEVMVTDNDEAPVDEPTVSAKSQEAVDAVFATAIVTAAGGPDWVEGGDAAMIDMSMLFNVIDDAAPSYSGMSSDDMTVSSSSSGMMLTLSPMAAGMATITVTATDAASGDIATAMADVTVAALTLSVMVSASAESVEEGGSIMVTATANQMVDANTEVMLMRDGASTASLDDYMLDPPLITIMAGETEGALTLTATDDTDVEGEEKLTLNGMVGEMAAGSVMLAITDNDMDITYTLSGPEDMNIAEGGSAELTATASSAVPMDTEVMVMRDGSSTASDADFTAESIMIMAGETTGTTMVMAVEDNEPDSGSGSPEMLTLYGMVDGMQTNSLSFYLWDAAVPALPVIAQLLLAAFLAVGGYRRYRRR